MYTPGRGAVAVGVRLDERVRLDETGERVTGAALAEVAVTDGVGSEGMVAEAAGTDATAGAAVVGAAVSAVAGAAPVELAVSAGVTALPARPSAGEVVGSQLARTARTTEERAKLRVIETARERVLAQPPSSPVTARFSRSLGGVGFGLTRFGTPALPWAWSVLWLGRPRVFCPRPQPRRATRHCCFMSHAVPPNPASSFPIAKLGLLASLYASQGLPFGFFAQALPVLMRQQNYSLRWIGLSTLLALPWGLKWLWAGVIDTVYPARWGRRRGWILPLQLLNCLTLAAVGVFGDSDEVMWLLVGSFMTNLFAATQDVATDGLAVEQLSTQERGLGNGVQVAGYRLGMIVGGSLLLVWFSKVGWTNAMLSLAAVLALLTIPMFLFRETPTRPGDAHIGAALTWFRQPSNWAWALVLLVYKFGDALATGMFKPYLVDAGLTLADIGWIDGALGSAAGLLGSVTGGLAFTRLGYRRAITGFGLVSATSTALYAATSAAVLPLWGYATLVVVEHFAGGMATVALFTAMMHYCRPGTEGSDYTVQASVVVVSTGVAASLSGFLAERVGYPGLFSLATLLSIAGAWWAGNGFGRGAAATTAPSRAHSP